MSDRAAKSIGEAAVVDGDESSISDAQLEAMAEDFDQIRSEVERIFIGPRAIIDSLMVALVAGGHILLEGVPGVAKTTLCQAFANTLGADFRRIQFTPDLLPSDITGTYVPDLGTNEFHLRRGPIFANILLGDEINRAPAKTQSALLEAMQERQVTIEGNTHDLPGPFMVLATQNPVEQQGVYPLPEAQLDRFLLKVTIDYPTRAQELKVLKTHRHRQSPPSAVVDAERVQQAAQLVEEVHASEEMMEYVLSLVRHTREDDDVILGGSPRASLALLRAAQARALIRGRGYVVPDDVRELTPSVLGHRILLHPDADLAGIRNEDVVERAIRSVRYG